MSRGPDRIIDLGVLRSDPEGGSGRGPGYDGGLLDWHAVRRLARDGWVAAVVGLASVALLGAAAAPVAPPGPVRVWTLSVPAEAGFAAAGGSLYLLDDGGGGWTLSARRLADGTPLWSVRMPDAGDWASLWLAGDTPLVTTPRPGSLDLVTAFDPATGRARWSESGVIFAPVVGDRVLLARPVSPAWPADDGTRPGDGFTPYDLLSVDLLTGEVGWQRRFGVGEIVLRTPQPVLTHLLAWTEEGRLTSYDPDTGEPLASVDMPVIADITPVVGDLRPAALGYPADLLVGEASLTVVPGPTLWGAEGLVVLPVPGAVAAYDAATLALRWRLSGPDVAWAVPCAELVCRYATEAAELAGLDPATGALRWSYPCAPAGPVPGDPCALLPLGRSPGALLLQRVELTGGQLSSVTLALDAASGELLGQVAGWAPQAVPDAARWLYGREDTDPLAERPGAPWLVRWRSQPAGFDVRGPIDADWCEPPLGDRLACVSSGRGRVEVWALR